MTLSEAANSDFALIKWEKCKMKPRNINNSLPLQPLVPDQENKNKKNEEKSVNPVKITLGSGLNHIEQESLGGKYLTHDLSIKIADISEEII